MGARDWQDIAQRAGNYLQGVQLYTQGARYRLAYYALTSKQLTVNTSSECGVTGPNHDKFLHPHPSHSSLYCRAVPTQYSMSFVYKEDQLVQNAIDELQELNPGTNPVLMARNAIMASNGNFDDAVVLLQNDAVKLSDNIGYLCRPWKDPLWKMTINAGNSLALHYTSARQIIVIVQYALVTLPIFLFMSNH